MQWIKAGCAGLIGAAFILVVMFVGIHVTGMAPFNLSPSAAFTAALGLPPMPLALAVHFLYGFFWAALLYGLFAGRVGFANALGLALLQWLLLMVVYGPVIGWGFFGLHAPNHALATSAPLYLGNPVKYVVLTLVLHLVYGVINAVLIPRWTGPQRPAGR